MDDVQNGLLDVAITNFSNAQTQTNGVGAGLQLVFGALQQVAGAVGNQVSDSVAKSLAQRASQNLTQGGNVVTDSVGNNDVITLALGLQQLTAAMKALS